MNTSLWGSLGAVVGAVAIAGSASAATYTIQFTGGTDGYAQSLYSSNIDNSGMDTPGVRLTPRLSSAYDFSCALFQVVLPPDIAGATNISATLSIVDPWGEAGQMLNVKLYQIVSSAPAWTQGNGSWDPATEVGGGDRWDGDSGATLRYANRLSGGGGTDWTGATQAADGGWPSVTTVFGATPLDTQTVTMTGGAVSTFTVTAAVQAWANGDANRGLALWTGDATGASGWTDHAYYFVTNATGAGLTINYTPVPEPGSLGLLALGALALVRRRRRA